MPLPLNQVNQINFDTIAKVAFARFLQSGKFTYLAANMKKKAQFNAKKLTCSNFVFSNCRNIYCIYPQYCVYFYSCTAWLPALFQILLSGSGGPAFRALV
jgi:hypothetical protein